ncbi:MAG: hypothetical protein FD161_57 [Limisphaerales bacterium]|nr:MAG: hypothetical protein FD161_57 [Limisphaerales bacterium]KAG0510503.1 MAG: hypothetical protein E1N63_57 [Limisphaerales bacterium]TXT52776.1 MAG: hypothetical protein FD140_319 [Limisphaerales bacterium]
MNDAVKLVDHAAARDDRWLMLALLLLFALSAVLAVRWLVGQLEAMQQRHATERDAILSSHARERDTIITTYRAERQERFEAMTAQSDKLGEIVKENTQIIARVLDRT